MISSASKLVIKYLQRFLLPGMNPECFLSTEAFYFKTQDGRRVYREATAGAGKRIGKKWKAQHARSKRNWSRAPATFLWKQKRL